MKQFLAMCAVLTFAAGCGGAKGDYTLALTGYTPHVGKTVRLKLKDTSTATPTTVGSETNAVIATDGSATLKLPGLLEEGKKYNADWFVDNDGNDACDTCGVLAGEHAWRHSVTGSTTAVSDSHVHDTNFTDISPF